MAERSETPRRSAEHITDPSSVPAAGGFGGAAAAVHKASTVIFANVAAMRSRDWREKGRYTYGLTARRRRSYWKSASRRSKADANAAGAEWFGGHRLVDIAC